MDFFFRADQIENRAGDNKRQERNSSERKPDVILQYNNQKMCKRLTSFDFFFDLF